VEGCFWSGIGLILAADSTHKCDTRVTKAW
jgi:hypothetical protein